MQRAFFMQKGVFLGVGATRDSTQWRYHPACRGYPHGPPAKWLQAPLADIAKRRRKGIQHHGSAFSIIAVTAFRIEAQAGRLDP